MKQMKLAIGVLLISLVCGCTTTYPVAWKTLPEFNVSYDKAWQVVLDVLTEAYDLEVVEKDAGYIKTSWKSGSLQGAPCQWKVACKFVSKSPIKVKVKVDGKIYDTWLEQWKITGLPGNEKALLEEIEGRLRGLEGT